MITLPENSTELKSVLLVIRTIIITIPLFFILFKNETELLNMVLIVPHIAVGILAIALMPNPYLSKPWASSRVFANIMICISIAVYLWIGLVLMGFIYAEQGSQATDYIYTALLAVYGLIACIKILKKASGSFQSLDRYVWGYTGVPYILTGLAWGLFAKTGIVIDITAMFFITLNLSMMVVDLLELRNRTLSI